MNLRVAPTSPQVWLKRFPGLGATPCLISEDGILMTRSISAPAAVR